MKKALRNIYLVRIQKDKIVPALLLDHISEDKPLKALEIRKTSGKRDKTVHIGITKGLEFNACVVLTACHTITRKQIVRKLARIDPQKYEEVMKEYRKLKPGLHKELHLLKKKILLAQLNNEDYSKFENRLNKILEELKYPQSEKREDNKVFCGFREAPSKGPIKIYLGGR